ncbi:MAG: hypothetical protein GY754_11625, partial [bacterium]|nr:hypothetical protein [bacterium]
FREALERFIYNIDNAHNGILLPEAVEFAKKYGTGNLPLHCGSHPNYTGIAIDEVEEVVNELKKVYGNLKNVPDNVLSKSIYRLEEKMKEIIMNWGKKVN